MSNKSKTWNLIDPDGDPIEVTNLAKFCKDRSLPYHRVWNMLNNNGSVYGDVMCGGWKKDPSSNSPTSSIARDEIQLKHDDGRITSRSRYRNRVAKEAGISTSSLHRLMSGKAHLIAGWRLTNENVRLDELIYDTDQEDEI